MYDLLCLSLGGRCSVCLDFRYDSENWIGNHRFGVVTGARCFGGCFVLEKGSLSKNCLGKLVLTFGQKRNY
jgi:hypothetical protein